MEDALQGIKVLDLTRLLPGPYCTLVLADHGAEVIKVESPQEGDYMRKMGPMIDENSAYFWQLNRNKKSISLNLKVPEGKELFKRLVAECDVLVEGFRPGVMEGLGLGYEQLRQANPRLVFCAISGYGQEGPYRLRAGHDINYTSIAGVNALSGGTDLSPVVPAIQLADIGGGSLWSLVAILLALHARRHTGRGQYLDISMTEGSMACLPLQFTEYFSDQTIPRRNEGLLSGFYACYNLYRTKDGKYVSLGALEAKFWRAFCEAVGHPEWVPRQYGPAPVQEQLKKAVASLLAGRTREEWVHFFAGNDDCCLEPLLELNEVEDHPQNQVRGFFLEVQHPQNGVFKQLGFPCRMSETPGRLQKAPPGLGEDTEPILQGMGLSAEEIAELKRKGAI